MVMSGEKIIIIIRDKYIEKKKKKVLELAVIFNKALKK
jgi:hypothetical protein